MERTTKIFVAAALACSIALAGCGSSKSASSASQSEAASSSQSASSAASSAAGEENGAGTLDLDSVFDTLLAADPISNQFEITAMNIEYDFGLPAENVIAYKGVKSNDNGDAGLVLVLEVPSGKADAVVEALNTYQKDQVAFYGNYAEFAQAQANIEKTVITDVGFDNADSADLVMITTPSNECTDTDALRKAHDTASASVAKN